MALFEYWSRENFAIYFKLYGTISGEITILKRQVFPARR